MKVLLIDDDKALLTVFETALKHDGYEVTTASSGKEAKEKTDSNSFDIIFLDQILPDTSGNELLKIFKKQENTKNIPIVILSNFSQDQLMQEAMSFGAEDYIYKYNIEPNELSAKIKEYTKSKGVQDGQQPESTIS